MWLEFAFSFVFQAVAIYLPGILFFWGIGIQPYMAVAFAPIFTIPCFPILGIVFSEIGIECTWLSLTVPVLAISMAVFLVGYFIRPIRKQPQGYSSDSRAIGPLPFVLFGLVGLTVTTFYFVRNLDGAASFLQAFDNGFHLSTVETFLRTKQYSSFHSGAYAPDDYSPFIRGEYTGFYPTAWHCIVAMTVDFVGCEITVAFNALSTLCSGIIFPLSSMAFISAFWQGAKDKLFAGAFFASAFAAFPLTFLTFGPLYPNLLSMTLLPCVIAAFLFLTSITATTCERIRYLVAFVLGLLACSIAQPNAIFSAAVILAPYCIFQTVKVARHLNSSLTRRQVWLIGLGAFAVIFAIWTLCYNLPFFHAVVSFVWPKRMSWTQAVFNAVSLSFAQNPVQLMLAIFVFLGLLRIIFDKKRSWLAYSYLFACLIFIVAVASDGPVKQFLAGFWYTDPYRLAATAVVAAIPLAIAGFEEALDISKRIAKLIWGTKRAENILRGIMVVLMLAIFMPSFRYEGIGQIGTGFGYTGELVNAQNSYANDDKVLTEDEIEFALEAVDVIPEGSRIINQPNDGSAFLYPLYGVDVVYRRFDLPALENEEDASITVRRALDEIGTNTEVQEAVQELDAEYVLLLDAGGEYDGREWFWSYYYDQWYGMNAITDDTPGLELVLAEGDMRLYRIVEN